ncbi:MAG: protein-glutamate O-methyltransferase CheR [Lentisphaeraceae bacterium]|nr:protein-glutamate O-methyltransferase CheR [Lentisphaeraceae bacterium]
MAEQISLSEQKQLAVELLLKTAYGLYGYDFRNYARASLNRRIEKTLDDLQLSEIVDLIPLLFKKPESFEVLLKNMSVTVTSFFRDPEVFKMIREEVIPVLKTYPFVKIWHAGCALGMEPYSMAIMLNEENFLKKCQFYCTDYNVQSLDTARQAIFKDEKLDEFEKNYALSGGKKKFSDYVTQSYDSFIMKAPLQKNMTFASHNLIADKSFGEMNMVFCRNVLIYFDQELQNRVLKLLTESLCHRGFLCLGNRETINYSAVADCYETVCPKNKIYRKK